MLFWKKSKKKLSCQASIEECRSIMGPNFIDCDRMELLLGKRLSEKEKSFLEEIPFSPETLSARAGSHLLMADVGVPAYAVWCLSASQDAIRRHYEMSWQYHKASFMTDVPDIPRWRLVRTAFVPG